MKQRRSKQPRSKVRQERAVVPAAVEPFGEFCPDDGVVEPVGGPVAAAAGDGASTDDALGLYLRQMGAIPMLNREKELKVSQLLEQRRRHYRRAALWNWDAIA